jgi:hypothetical protein
MLIMLCLGTTAASSISWRGRMPSSMVNATCVPRGAFTALNFQNSTLVRSFLGGAAGRCVDAGACAEAHVSWGTPHELYIRNVGYHEASATAFDVRITNESEYRAWNARLNGPSSHQGTSWAFSVKCALSESNSR